jgi:hypothetical protein
MAFIVKRDAVVIPAGLPYSSTASVAINIINFTLLKENNNGDGNLLYVLPYPNVLTTYYGFNSYDIDTGIGNRAVLFFNTTATTYPSNQTLSAPDVSLSQNTWYLIVFTAGYYDDGTIPPVPTSVYVNNSSGQSANYIPTTNWTPTVTITAA